MLSSSFVRKADPQPVLSAVSTVAVIDQVVGQVRGSREEVAVREQGGQDPPGADHLPARQDEADVGPLLEWAHVLSRGVGDQADRLIVAVAFRRQVPQRA
jgi:hypothetical protein